ncbi:hypothetical protein [Pseudomonas putida]|uniref:Uncharacterized protein n=1 Tax=Pseudomonas putida TaxID=303 RepID=A0A8I1E9S8_PSEPU|nr:hypothetical protein [Pseudomonas putida]MBI6882434.1 hypothetical protein [Pseudomonas putida]
MPTPIQAGAPAPLVDSWLDLGRIQCAQYSLDSVVHKLANASAIVHIAEPLEKHVLVACPLWISAEPDLEIMGNSKDLDIQLGRLAGFSRHQTMLSHKVNLVTGKQNAI